MRSSSNRILESLVLLGLSLSLSIEVDARAPKAAERDTAIAAGDLEPYFVRLSRWLDEKVPSDPSRITPAKLRALLADEEVMAALAERHFMSKIWGEAKGTTGNLDAFANAAPENRVFLAWLLSSPGLMDEVMLARTPTAMFARIDDSHSIDGKTLAAWREIYDAYPESREGLYSKLAAATVLRPPGTANQGAGRAETQSSILDRYTHFLKAHQSGELLPSFDELGIWEMTHVVSSCASNADLAWGRETLSTWNPEFKQGERVVMLTSQMKYQGSQIPYRDMSCLLAGGGKCGPRSSFGVFINQAFGIPSIGVGQPGHAAVCWRDRSGQWQLGYGKGWNVSKVVDRYKMSGAEFLAAVKDRGTPHFGQVEHLRWLAAVVEKPGGSYLPPADRRYASPRAAAVMAGTESLPIPTGNLGDLPFDRKPDRKSALTSFEAPASDGEFYHARVRGFVHPPKTGDYVFSITSDDDSDLFLSLDESPQNKVFIAHVSGWSDPKDFSRKSKPVRLEGGRKYYIEAVHRELDGGDHLTVAWSGPRVAESVIPGSALSHPSLGKGRIVREVWEQRASEEPPTPSPVELTVKPEPPIDVAPGVIHLEAEDFAHQGGIGGYGYPGVPILPCEQGGKQVHFGALMQTAWVGYKINVPETQIYELTARVSVINWGQRLYARSFGAMYPVESAKASDVFHGQVDALGPQMAIDHDLGTRWAMNFGKDEGWIELDLGQPRKISKVMIDERHLNQVSKFQVDYKAGDDWKLLFEGETLEDFKKDFPPVTAQFVRLTTLDSRAPTGGPTIWDFSVGDTFDGSGWINVEWSPGTAESDPGQAGRWQTTKPIEMSLVKGEQTIWLCAPSQRGLSMRWFELTPKSR